MVLCFHEQSDSVFLVCLYRIMSDPSRHSFDEVEVEESWTHRRVK